MFVLKKKNVFFSTGEVLSASINKLVERLTSIDTINLQLTQIFLSTFKSFTTSGELWAKLMERYNCPSVVPEAERKQIRTRVCLFLKKWMESRSTGDLTPDLQMQIMNFIENNLVADGLQEMQTVLLRVMTGTSTEKVFVLDRRNVPKPKLPKVKTVEKMTVLDLDPLELARQITIKAWEIFTRIRPNEFFNQNWMKANASETAPGRLFHYFIFLFLFLFFA